MGGGVILPPMATLSSAPRFTTATLASATAGPFNIGFRVFATSTTTAKDALEVLVNGAVRTDFTVSGTFTSGYSDTATINFTAPLAIADVVDIYGNLEPERQEDLISTGLTRLLNLELPRLWTSVADMLIKAKSAVRLAGGVAAPPITYDDGKVLIMQDSMIKAGPSADEITNAQSFADAAAASAAAAAISAASAGTQDTTFLQRSGLRCTIGGTANAITLTTGGSVLSVVAGQQFRFRATSPNAGGVTTIAVDGVAAAEVATITGITGGSFPAGYIRTDVDTIVTWNGSRWVAEREIEQVNSATLAGRYIKHPDGRLEGIIFPATESLSISSSYLGGFKSANRSLTLDSVFPSGNELGSQITIETDKRPVVQAIPVEGTAFGVNINGVAFGTNVIEYFFTAFSSQTAADRKCAIKFDARWY